MSMNTREEEQDTIVSESHDYIHSDNGHPQKQRSDDENGNVVGTDSSSMTNDDKTVRKAPQDSNRTFYYQNAITGTISTIPLSLEQLCLLLSPPNEVNSTAAATVGGGGTSSANTTNTRRQRPIHESTLVIEWDTKTQNYSTEGWKECRQVPILREACANWHYQHPVIGNTVGPISCRTLSSLFFNNKTTNDNSSSTSGQNDDQKEPANITVDNNSESSLGGRGGSAEAAAGKKDVEPENNVGSSTPLLLNLQTLVWSPEIAALVSAATDVSLSSSEPSSEQQPKQAQAQATSSLTNWRPIGHDFNLQVALRAFYNHSQKQPLVQGEGEQEQQPQSLPVSYDANLQVYDIQENDDAAVDTGSTNKRKNDNDDGETKNKDETESHKKQKKNDKEEEEDELQKFLSSAVNDGDEDDYEEYVSDHGTHYVKDYHNKEQWIRKGGKTHKRQLKEMEADQIRMNELIKQQQQQQQTNSSSSNNVNDSNNKNKQSGTKKKKKTTTKSKFNAKNAAKWIYIQGLPKDTTEDEVATHFQRVGIIELHPETQKPRIKLYRSSDGEELKGDASLCYAREESVELAVQILDEGMFRPSAKLNDNQYPLRVSKAKFEQRGDTMLDTSAQARQSYKKKKIAKLAAKQAMDWDDGDIYQNGRLTGGLKGLRIIVLKHVFTLEDIPSNKEEQDLVLRELESKIYQECSQFGTVEKITIISQHPQGIVIVKFTQPQAATDAIRSINNGSPKFGTSKVEAIFWDGVTDYTTIHHDDELHEQKEMEQRHDEFGDWLDQQNHLPEEFQLRVEGGAGDSGGGS